MVLGFGLGLSRLAWNRWMAGTWTDQDVTVELWPETMPCNTWLKLEAQPSVSVSLTGRDAVMGRAD